MFAALLMAVILLFSGSCQEDMPCWDSCTMGNHHPCEAKPNNR